ncbi:hypothetical protein ACMFMG_006834 [Clarireedia jacksonii]
MTLLEAITIEALTGSLQSVPNTLQTTKKALTQCKSHLHCSTHTTDPSSLMLVTIICQKLIAIYQRTVTILYNQFNKIYHPNLGHVHDRDAMNAAQEKAAQVVLFGYEVAVEEEPVGDIAIGDYGGFFDEVEAEAQGGGTGEPFEDFTDCGGGRGGTEGDVL